MRAAGRGCAILVRNRNALGATVPALKAANIRFRAIEIESLGEKQVVQDLYALTRALTHLADRVAWLALLRAPWCGATLAELSGWFEGRRETVWEIAQEQAQAVPQLQRLCAVLLRALAGRQRGTLRDRVEGVWLALGGPACVTDATDLADAEVYLDALEELEDAGEVDFGRLAELLDELYAAPDVTAGDDDVQIMTIHKAKGLEFDTVIVPGLERGPGRGEPPLMLWRARAAAKGNEILLAPIKETGANKEPVYEYLKALDIAAEDTESARILYVAATRAQSRLHLLACPKKTMPPKRSLLACAWPVAAASYDGHSPAVAQAAPAAAMPPTFLMRLPAVWRLPAPPAAVAWRAPVLAQQEQDPIEFSWAGETARHVGSVVHRWMQCIAEDGLGSWTAARVDALRPRLARELEAHGVAPGECEDAAVRAARALAQTLADERGRWLLGPHAGARSEYRVRVAAGDSVRTCVMDRVFTDETGTRWIVDYKTGGHEGGDTNAFLDRERERYHGQLARYARALNDGTPQKLGLYFPMVAGWREWKE